MPDDQPLVPPDDLPIPPDRYREMLQLMPFPCVDVVIPSSNGVLLVWRENEPAKHQWWLPGGRVLKGETLAACAERKAREEVGLHCTFQRIVHVEETIFETGPWGIPVHTVNVCALLALNDPSQEPVLDPDHSKSIWLSSLDGLPLAGYVTRCIEKSGVLS